MTQQSYFLTIRQLAAYEVWCNARALDAAAALSEQELYQRFPFGFGTVHATLFHTVEVFQMWSGCVGPTIAKAPLTPYNETMSLEQMATWNAELSKAFTAAVDASHAAGLLACDRRLVQLFHLLTHGTHHRTQFITMLRLLGKEPPFEAGDFGGWSREN